MAEIVADKGENTGIKVSVILPVYNVRPYIGACIESLRKQRLDGLEFIIVDDCSTDGSTDAVRDFAEEDGRVKLLTNKENLGAGPSRNHGIEHAEGQYLSFIDPDDFVSDNFYEELYNAAVSTGCDIVKGVRAFVPEGARPEDVPLSTLNNRIKKNMRKGLPLYYAFTYEHQTALFKKDLFLDKNARYGRSRNGQDTTFLLRVCTLTESIGFTDAPIYYYMQRQGAATYSYSLRRSERELDALREKIEFVKTKPGLPYKKYYLLKWIENVQTGIAYACADAHLPDDAIRHLAEEFSDAVDLSGIRSFVLQESPETGIFFDQKFAIPKAKKRTDPFFSAGLERWTDYFVTFPGRVLPLHIREYAAVLIRVFVDMLRKRNKETKKAESAFYKSQLSRLRPEQRRIVFMNLPPSFMKLLIKRIRG